MKRYLRIQIAINSLIQSEEYIAALSDIGFYAFEQDNPYLLAYIEEKDFTKAEFEKIVEPSRAKEPEVIEDENWNARWEKDFTPVVVGDFAAIRAEFHEPFPKVKHDLVITPRMSFGTGHHPTTYLMVEAMRDISFAAKTVLDFGTGTGVLAILAKKLGAQHVIAIDYDEWSIINTKENIEANHCNDIEVVQADKPQIPMKADVILANINLHILQMFANELHNLLKDDGILVVSGFLKSDENKMETTFANFLLTVDKRLFREDWCCLIFKK